MRSLFIHDTADLDAAIPGGVQLCTREFLAIVRAASNTTSTLAVSVSRTPALRLRRRFRLGSYLHYDANALEPAIAAGLAESNPTHVFLNRAELLRLAPVIRKKAPHCRIVIMSHGNQSGDDLYEMSGPRGRLTRGLSRWAGTWKLGLDLVTESWHRHRFIDAVAAMSVEEAVLERWLGTRRVVVLPRVIQPAPVQWNPVPMRCGYVGTLDHTPNLAAIEQVCTALAKTGASLELRVVGNPRAVGEDLAARFHFVSYLGPLSAEQLRAESASWGLFLNPILWLARGASMKLGQGLSYGLPVLTTLSGVRGYEFGDAQLPTVPDSAEAFSRKLLELLSNPARLVAAQQESKKAIAQSPSIETLAGRLRNATTETDAG